MYEMTVVGVAACAVGVTFGILIMLGRQYRTNLLSTMKIERLEKEVSDGGDGGGCSP